MTNNDHEVRMTKYSHCILYHWNNYWVK